MPGGIIQLIAYGSEDLYLTGNPQITFFNTVYRRYTNFSSEYIELYQQSTVSINGQNRVLLSFKIDRNADLIYDSYFIINLPAITTNGIPFGWVEDVGNCITYKMQLLIGGQIIEERTGLWNSIESRINLENNKLKNYKSMIDGTNNLNYTNQPGLKASKLYIPLNFFFCKNSGLALPLISLQYTDVYINIELNSTNNIYRIGNPLISPQKMLGDYDLNPENLEYKTKIQTLSPNSNQYTLLNDIFAPNWKPTFNLLVNYIYLDEDERTKLAQNSLEYLITQVQSDIFQGLIAGPNTLDLKFLHPTKELIWVLQDSENYLTNDWLNFTNLEYPDNLTFINQNLFNNSIQLYYPSLKQYLNSNTITDYFTFIQDEYGTIDINNENIDSDYNNYFSIMKNAKLMFNSHDRFSEKEYGFFERLQIYKYHNGSGGHGIFCYNFGLKPDEFQPSGTCNLSRIQKQQLKMELFSNKNKYYRKYNCYIYAVNYNVLRIMGGIGQMVFSN